MASFLSHPFTPKRLWEQEPLGNNIWTQLFSAHCPPSPAPASSRDAPESHPSSASVKALVLLLLPRSPFLLPPESRQETSLRFASLNFFLLHNPQPPGQRLRLVQRAERGGGGLQGPGMQGSRLQGVGCSEWDERIEMRDTEM